MSIRTLSRSTVLIAVVALSVVGLAAPGQAAIGDDTSFALQAGATPYGTVLGPDNNIWVANGAANSISKVDAKGTVTNYPVPTAASTPRFITVGSDRNLWFTEQTGNKIGRITPAGVITEFAVPTTGAEPFGIAPGPDGNLWFTEQAANKIGRITTTGTITEFPIPTAASVPYGIVAGPTGSNDMYFTESATDKIGRITSSGAVTEIPLAAGSRPFGITTVSSTLWIAEYGSNKIAQLQGSTVLEISLPAGSQPLWLAQGPGPTMWVTLFGTSQVAVLTAAGSLQASYGLVAGTKPTGLAQGSDGNMWVAQSGSAQVARVLSGQTPTMVTAPAVTPTTAAVGATVTSSSGTWAYEPTSYTYQWVRCTTNAASSCSPITGSTASTYVVTTADSGKFIGATVAAVNLNGAVTGVTGNLIQIGGTVSPTAAPTATPTPTPTSTAAVKPAATLVTVSAAARTKRGKTTTVTITLSPATAAGLVNVTYKGGAVKSTVKGLRAINGVISTTWSTPSNWPAGRTRITARFYPTSTATAARGSGFDFINVRK
jgi:streptogramin lyase